MDNCSIPDTISVKCVYSKDSAFIEGKDYEMVKNFDNLYIINGEEGGYGDWASVAEMNKDFEGSYVFQVTSATVKIKIPSLKRQQK